MKKLKTTRYELNITKHDFTPGQVRLAFLTDLHNVENGPANKILLDAIKEAHPDLILCGGDMIRGHENQPVTVARDFMLSLAEEYPIYHALGNHEHRTKLYPHQYGTIFEDYKKPLEKAGVIFLDNEFDLLTIRGIPLQITGCTLERKYYKRFSRFHLDASEINETVGEPNPRALNILMAHHPFYMDTYRNWGADLTLCGHYHGGMVRYGTHSGLVTPDFLLFNDKCCGHFEFHQRIANGVLADFDSHIIVGAGLGEHTLPFRINNPRELVIVDLICGTDHPVEE